MKHYSGSFNKRSRLLQAPALSDSSAGRLKPLQPDGLAEHLEQVLQVQNDFFPCFDIKKYRIHINHGSITRRSPIIGQ